MSRLRASTAGMTATLTLTAALAAALGAGCSAPVRSCDETLTCPEATAAGGGAGASGRAGMSGSAGTSGGAGASGSAGMSGSAGTSGAGGTPLVEPCVGAADGTACALGRVCISEQCEASRCGDGAVDGGAEEDCEPALDGDGCDPATCRWRCEEDADCADDDVCNGAETCDASAHVCRSGAAVASGTACGVGRVCLAERCEASRCGDGFVDNAAQEDCEAKLDGAGCDPATCRWRCVTDADCADDDLCNGAETCDTSAHRCRAGAALGCDDGNYCTVDDCDAATGCTHALDAESYDVDRDGYTAVGVSCPEETPGVFGTGDCEERNPSVHPGETAGSPTPYVTRWGQESFDYNCDGKEEDNAGECSLVGYPFCCSTWAKAPGPGCGMVAAWVTRDLGALSCFEINETRIQACR